MKRQAAILTAICLLLLLAPALSNLAIAKWQHAIDCTGVGSPTVVVEAGTIAPGLRALLDQAREYPTEAAAPPFGTTTYE
jgi:hypothetical protein